MGVDLMELWGHAGPFAKGVVYVMLLMSLMSLTVAIKKLILFNKTTRSTRAFAPAFSSPL